jgi:uncharacterized protein
MADHPNVELIRKGYAAYSSGDMETINELFADNIEWHVPGRGPLAGDYHGKNEVFGFFGKLMEMSGGTSRLEVHDVLANDEHGVGLVTAFGSREGRDYTGQQVHTFHIRDGKVVEFWESALDQYGADEFWS